MRTEQQQRMLDSLRRRITRDKETGFIPTLRSLNLKHFPTHVSTITKNFTESIKKKPK